jgi:hypothetical protein
MPNQISDLKDYVCTDICIVLVLGVGLLGCNTRTTRVELSHGYTGDVTIDCRQNNNGIQTITVDSTGHVANGTCPKEPTKLIIVRDGRVIQPTQAATWETSGDGIPISIHFTVR